MASQSRALLGVYMSADQARRAVLALRTAGFRSTDVEVLSDAPYAEGTFGEEPPRHHLHVFALAGAACGLVVGLVLTIGMQMAYPMVQGGKPLLSIPPTINVLFEGTLLGAIVLTFLGVLFESRLPDFSGEPYDARISEGALGVLVRRLTPSSAVRADQALRSAGALDVLGSPSA
jgi:hypothetical protein